MKSRPSPMRLFQRRCFMLRSSPAKCDTQNSAHTIVGTRTMTTNPDGLSSPLMWRALTRRARCILALMMGVLVVLCFVPRGTEAAAGDLDPNFGVGGKVTTDFFGGDDTGDVVAIQSDGKIVVAGTAFQPATGPDFALARYNTTGTLDSTFGS